MNDTVLRVQANQKKTITQLTAQTCPGCGGRPHQAGHSFAVPSLHCHLSLLPKGVQEYEFHFLQFPNTTYYHPYNSSQLITFTEWSFQQCLTNRTMEEKISHDIYNMVLSCKQRHDLVPSNPTEPIASPCHPFQEIAVSFCCYGVRLLSHGPYHHNLAITYPSHEPVVLLHCHSRHTLVKWWLKIYVQIVSLAMGFSSQDFVIKLPSK